MLLAYVDKFLLRHRQLKVLAKNIGIRKVASDYDGPKCESEQKNGVCTRNPVPVLGKGDHFVGDIAGRGARKGTVHGRGRILGLDWAP